MNAFHRNKPAVGPRMILLAIGVTACGGGGAAVGPATPPSTASGGTTTTPAAPTPATPSTPAPSGSVVTTSGTSFTPATVTIATGATVVWNIAGATHNVTFGANKPTGGDIPDTPSGGTASRTFPTSGTFPYQCTRHSGMTGQIIVQGGASPSTPSNPVPAPEIIVQALGNRFNPEEVNVAPGTTVTWQFSTAGGITFKDKSPSGGDIATVAAGGTASRTFTGAGDYDYYSSVNRDVKGRIRVK